MIAPSQCEMCVPTVAIETHGMGREVHTRAHQADCVNNKVKARDGH